MKLSPKKSLGQNFLQDEKIINLIVESGNINKKDLILEVGPGTGNLTQKLLEKTPKSLTVIEKDESLVNHLNLKFGNKINIINYDMMDISYDKYRNNDLIIFGNLPYNISTQMLAKWIKMKNLDKFCKRFVLMFQKEVADRIIAKTNTKNYGRLSIISNWKFDIEKIMDIEPYCFNPAPKVNSTLLVFTPKKFFFEIKDPRNLEHVTNVFFSQRRKMIKKPLKILFKNYEEISKKMSLKLSYRPQNLDNLTFYKICEFFEKSID